MSGFNFFSRVPSTVVCKMAFKSTSKLFVTVLWGNKHGNSNRHRRPLASGGKVAKSCCVGVANTADVCVRTDSKGHRHPHHPHLFSCVPPDVVCKMASKSTSRLFMQTHTSVAGTRASSNGGTRAGSSGGSSAGSGGGSNCRRCYWHDARS